MTAPASTPGASITSRTVLAIAAPIMLSNVSTPLLGVVDTAVVGRLPDPAYIGAVALGALIFNFVFWGFGFLRMGTTGLTAQALGARDVAEVRACLGRALLLALIVGAALIALQWPIRLIALALLEGSEKVEALAHGYFDVRIWAAPATLANFALLGWFIGLGQARTALILQLVLNVSNMLLDALFVLGLGLGVSGVAAGTVIAETLAAALGIVLALRHLRSLGGRWSVERLFDRLQLARAIAVNRDIMIRSAALILIFVWFTAQGARQGDLVLAANAVLMQFIAVAAYFLDGIAFTAEALVGRAAGAGSRSLLVHAARLTTAWAALIALLASLALVALGPSLIDLLTVEPGVRATARTFLAWAALGPLAGVWAFQLDGIFIGATWTAQMRNAMLATLAIFLTAWWLLRPWGNHGLWAALYVSYAARALTQLYFLPGLMRALPDAPAGPAKAAA
jgi:MATE family multidrug resistance protein